MGFWATRLAALLVLPASLGGLLALDVAAHATPPLRRVRDLAWIDSLLRSRPLLPLAAAPLIVDEEPDTGGPLDLTPVDEELEDGEEDPVYLGADGQLVTVERIAGYLEQYASPLEPYAADIVRAGRRWDVDPRLIVAISGTESTFGRYHHGHNAWGWDAPNGLTRWPSWRAGIARYTRLFATSYKSRDPRNIGPRYSPLDPTWGETTSFFFAQM